MIAAAGIVFAALAGEPVATSDLDMVPTRWRIAKMRYTVNSKQRAGGYIVWVQTADRRGAAFRCDKGILYAFIAMREVDIYDNLTRLGGTRKERKVMATVGNFAAREEKWISIHGGSFLMPRRISTTKRLFRGARDGIFVRIDAGNRDPVTVEVPADRSGMLDEFEERCELKDVFFEQAGG